MSGMIITGHHRSGTTVLMEICDSHPEISITNEAGWYMALNMPLKDYRQFMLKRWLQKRNNSIIVKHNQSQQGLKGVDFLRNTFFVFRYLANLRLNGHKEVGISTVNAALSRMFPNSRLVGDKYPDYWFKLDELAGINELKCVMIYRDARDMVSSVLVKSRGEFKNYWPAELSQASVVASRWVELINKMEHNKDRVHPICYEDLAKRPSEVLQDLAGYLGVDPSGFNIHDLYTSSIGNYQKYLTPEEVTQVIDVAGDTMKRLGYTI